MYALVWLASGLVAGWLARFLMKGRRVGFLGDFALGVLGSVTGSWLLKSAGGSVPPADSPGHVLVAVVGAMLLVALARLLLRATAGARRLAEDKRLGRTIPDLEAQIRRLGAAERRVLGAVLRHEPIAHDPNEAFTEQLTLGQRLADRVASFGGSWTFLSLFAAFMLGWMLLNTEEHRPFDPFPFILLNLVLSCLAAVQAPVIMMSQNRQAAKDRLDAQLDYQVNLKAEMEIMSLHVKLDEARERHLQTLLDLQNRQMEVLGEIGRRLDVIENNGRGAPPA